MKCLGCDRPMSLWETLRDIFRPPYELGASFYFLLADRCFYCGTDKEKKA
jgi:hypothetical protein